MRRGAVTQNQRFFTVFRKERKKKSLKVKNTSSKIKWNYNSFNCLPFAVEVKVDDGVTQTLRSCSTNLRYWNASEKQHRLLELWLNGT